MRFRFLWPALVLASAVLRAEVPPLLAKAVERWAAGREGIAFTQHTRYFHDDGRVKEERIEHYDPSLPDSRRWRLVEVDGRRATDAQRLKWETKKNGKARAAVARSPVEYLDLEHATLLDATSARARFEIALRPEAARLLDVEKIAVVITVDKESGSIARIAATLRQPIRVLLGLARITDLDLDVRIESTDEESDRKAGDVQTGSTARITMSKLGYPMEYSWSNFRRVTSFVAPLKRVK